MPREQTIEIAVDATGLARSVAHLDQYFGLWAAEEQRLSATLSHIRGMDLGAHIAAQINAAGAVGGGGERKGSGAGGRGYAINADGLAVIDCIGMMTKYGSSLSTNPGSLALRRAVRNAADDSSVRGIMLRVDSPGGLTAGTGDLADDVAEAARAKPVHAYIEDLGASAAYWVASQAARVSSNPQALVGSIGTYAVITDSSGAAEREGFKVHVVRSGEFKGAGTAGTKVTDEQLAEWQRQINSANDVFVAAVSRGRGMSAEAARALADGRVHVGEAARSAGLIDAVESWDSAMQNLERAAESWSRGSGSSTNRTSGVGGRAGAAGAPGTPTTTHGKGTTMSSSTTEAPNARSAQKDPEQTSTAAPTATTVATIGQLKAAFPKAGAEFREKCLEGGFSMEQATKAWADELSAENDRLRAAAAKAPESPAAPAARQRGVAPVGAGIAKAGDEGAPAYSGDAVSDFDSAVREQMKLASSSRADAVKQVATKRPELHRAFLLATNSDPDAKAAIERRFR